MPFFLNYLGYENWAELISVAVQFFGFLGTACALVYNFRSIRMNAYIKYFERYDKIMEQCPKDFFTKSTEVNINYSKRIFNLFGEEYFLKYRVGMIPVYVWSVWVSGMRGMLKNPVFLSYWKALNERKEYDYYDEYRQYVESLIDK
jgi:hypothetical protein